MDLDALAAVRSSVDALSLQRLIYAAIVAGGALHDDDARHALATQTALLALGHDPNAVSSSSPSSSSSSSASSTPLPHGSIGPELSLWLDHFDVAHDSTRRRGVVKASTLAALRRLADDIAGIDAHEHAVLGARLAALHTSLDDRAARGLDVDDEAMVVVRALVADLLTRGG